MSKLSNPAVNEQATTQYEIFDDLVGLATRPWETVLASVALFVLRLMRPKLKPGHVRMEWLCTCGVQLYADYSDFDELAEFQESLRGTRERVLSFAHVVGNRGRLRLLHTVESTWAYIRLATAVGLSSGICMGIAANTVIDAVLMVLATFLATSALVVAVVTSQAGKHPALSGPLTRLCGPCADRTRIATNYRSNRLDPPAAQALGSTVSPHVSPTDNYGFPVEDLRYATPQSANQDSTCEFPVFLELCVSRGLESVRWGEIKLRDTNILLVDSDAKIFGTQTHFEASVTNRIPTF